jgi:hypothetical protein
MLVFNKYFYKKKKSKLYFGDRVAVLNDFIYRTGGSRQYVFLTELLLYYVSCLYFSGLDVNQIYILFLGINMKMSRLLMLLQLMRAHPYRIRCMAMGRLDLSCQLEEHMTSY